MKKVFCSILIFLIIGFAISIMLPQGIYAAGESNDEIFDKLDQSVDEQLGMLDLSGLDKILEELGLEDGGLFENKTFAEKVQSILDGEFAEDTQGFLQAFLKLIFDERMYLQYNTIIRGDYDYENTQGISVLSGIAVVAILCGIITNMKSGFISQATGEIVFFACFALVIVLTLSCAAGLIESAENAVRLLKKQMNIAFPILLTLMAGVGGVVSAKAYQPAVALLSGGVAEIVANVILPLFVFTLVFSVVGNLSKSVKLSKLTDFFKSTSVTILAITFTVFTAFMSVQGLTAGAFDSVSIRAAKFATKSYIPILGGYLADGFDLILAGGLLVKNSVGVAGLLLLVSTILSPIIQILAVTFGLKLVAAIVEPATDERITSFLTSVSKNLNMLIVAILAVAFMYFISIMLLIFTSNAFF